MTGDSALRARLALSAETIAWAVLYAGAMVVGRLSRVDTELALVWPAAGVSVVWFLRAGTGHRRLVAAAVLAAVTGTVNWVTGVEPVGSWLFAGVNVAHGLVGVAVLGRLVGWRTARAMSSLGDVAALLSASAASAVVSAVLGGLVAATRFGTEVWDGIGLIGVRNGISTFVVASALLAVPQLRLIGSRVHRAGSVLLVLAVLAVSLAVVLVPWPVAFMLIPPTVAVALRCGPAVTSVVAGAQGVLVVLTTRAGEGPFSLIPRVAPRILEAQALILVLALVGAVVSLALQERSAALVTSRLDRDRLRAHMDAALVANAHVVSTVSTAPEVLDVNGAMMALTGRTRAELVGTDPCGWLTPASAALLGSGIGDLTSGSQTGWRGELQLADGWGAGWVDAALSAVGSTGLPARPELNLQMIDVTVQKEAEERLATMALHDELTGLPNRVLWADRLEIALSEAGRSGSVVGILYVDVDHFKEVNDRHGHDVGDELLREIARRLSGVVRPHDTVARIGGDEFVVLCPRLQTTADGLGLAARIQQVMAAPVQAGPWQLTPTVSVGVAFADGDDDPRVVLRRADTALYTAKDRGRARFEVYRPNLEAELERSAQVLDRLGEAQRNGELRVHYQPVVDAGTRRVVALEALLRWEHPERGTLSPKTFLDVLESSELIHSVGGFVLRQACDDAAELLARGHRLAVHVNISARELARPGLREDVEQTLVETGMPAELLVLEITETRLVAVNGSLLRDLHALRARGVRVAVDDFGTGYSALTQLVELPVDVLKLDKGFVSEITTSARARAVSAGVQAMAAGLGVVTIAEGVETERQAEELAALGFELLQGFLFGRPRAMVDWLEELAAGRGGPWELRSGTHGEGRG
ncbi:EAL domain-containing protein [Nocardioides sp. SLBN-35]|uniref:bifunctional diguanylate cyclase/phosphodiesterase n=1 Tax=Nocardioides sp. SLBN-35 TaxID=2768445 RepID=UPI00114F7949|nr:EAL domain-containing protein [Nocardioides sp. SLBN-35]TQK69223.1 diguanylate cyclase (GGDEF)-like protein [Nocardioides sp. SLBN-35]